MSNTWLGAGLLKLSDGCNINRKTRPYKPFNDRNRSSSVGVAVDSLMARISEANPTHTQKEIALAYLKRAIASREGAIAKREERSADRSLEDLSIVIKA